MKKLFSIMLIALVLCCGLTACSGGGEAKITGVYLTPATLSYTNMRPTYNYYLTTFTHQELTLYDNGTYCLIESASTFSALELAESTNDAKGNERTNYVMKYYGTYTSAVNELDEDLLDVTLATPTRVVKSYDQNYWLDTDNWDDNMGAVTRPVSGYDMSTGTPIIEEGTPNATAAEYLATVAFPETVVMVNQKTSSFDFTDLSMPEA